MPLYEYECTRCGFRFERILRLCDPPPAECPECQGPVRKLLSSPAFQFKGEGWYVTDYASKEEKRKRAGEGKDPGGTKEEGTKGPKEEGTKGPKEEGTKGPKEGATAPAAGGD